MNNTNNVNKNSKRKMTKQERKAYFRKNYFKYEYNTPIDPRDNMWYGSSSELFEKYGTMYLTNENKEIYKTDKKDNCND